MSEWGSGANGRFWAGVPICISVALLVSAAGAAVTVWGLTSCENAWVWIGASWGVAGVLGGRFAARGDKRALLWSVIYVVAAMLIAWLLGLTAAEVPLSRHWLWYIGAGLLGAILGTTVPCRRKKRRRKGKGKRVAGR